ncbi:MAG: hypothetical protein V4501_11155 [Pseudomonadota bacterium]
MAKADCKKCRGMGSYYGAGCLSFQCECQPSPLHEWDIAPDKAKNYEAAHKVKLMSNSLPKAKYKNPYDLIGSFNSNEKAIIGRPEQILDEQMSKYTQIQDVV